jgi:hypothetical protein
MALNANRPLDSTPVNQAEVAQDVETLYRAGQAKVGTDEVWFSFALLVCHLTCYRWRFARC